MSRRLRVAVDATPLQQRPLGGVGRLLQQHLPRAAEHVDLVLLTERKRPAPELDLPTVALGLPRAMPRLLWLQTSVWRWLRSFDGIFHGPFYSVPFGCPVPSVVSLHDLSFEVGEIAMPPLKRALWQRFARHAARSSPVIVTDAEFVVDEITAQYHVERGRIVLAPPAPDPMFGPSAAAHGRRLAAACGLPPRFAVALGGTVRRQPDVAVRAFTAAREASGLGIDELGLALVGAGPAAPAAPGVVQVGAASDEDWAGLLAAAEVFVYATRYEGYGIPAVEALASGTPVVAAQVGALPEVLGEAAAWAERADASSLATALTSVLTDADRGRQLRELGRSRLAALPSWDESTARLVEAYQRAAQHGSPGRAGAPGITHRP